MDFGTNQMSDDKIDIHQKKTEIKLLLQNFFQSDNFDQNKVFQLVIEKLGRENVDEQMLNFAIRQSVGKIETIKKSKKPDKIEIDRAIDLIVDWSLIKLKSKSSENINSSKDQLEIGTNQPNQSTIDSLL